MVMFSVLFGSLNKNGRNKYSMEITVLASGIIILLPHRQYHIKFPTKKMPYNSNFSFVVFLLIEQIYFV